MSTPAERRRALRVHMDELAGKGRHCGTCSGVCCTFVANSMQITPQETLDLYRYLQAEGRWNAGLLEQLEENVRHYRLDSEPPGNGRRTFVRRRYTCPFFAGGQLGCTIHPNHKPYGCLAFNARRPGLTEGGDCASEEPLLEALLKSGRTEDFDPPWEKMPIPVALLDLAQAQGTPA